MSSTQVVQMGVLELVGQVIDRVDDLPLDGGDVGRRHDAVVLTKDDDEVGGDLQKLFPPVGAELGQRVEPFVGEAPLVVFAFLFFGGLADAALHVRVGDDDKVPGLLVRS